jgi:hypothetical protein
MLLAGRLGWMGTQPPERITDAVLDATDVDVRSEQSRHALAVTSHLAFGAGCGMLFAAATDRIAVPIPPVLQGVGFGLLVWAASYAGWIPALGILPPPTEDHPGRPATMAASHVVYGAVLGIVARPQR